MGIERENSGIYRTTRRSLDRPLDVRRPITSQQAADLRALLGGPGDAEHREQTTWLDNIERDLKAILDAADTGPTIRGDAEAAWGSLGMVKGAIARGDACTVEGLYWAFRLGREVERLAVRPIEHIAVFGRRAKKRGSNAGKGRTAKYEAMYSKWQRAIDESYRRHNEQFAGMKGKTPKWSYLQACVRAADHFEVKVNPKTVERHTKNPAVC